MKLSTGLMLVPITLGVITFLEPGSNLSFRGWIMIKDPNGNVMDAFVANWDAAAIANSTIGLGTVWTGPAGTRP